MKDEKIKWGFQDVSGPRDDPFFGEVLVYLSSMTLHAKKREEFTYFLVSTENFIISRIRGTQKTSIISYESDKHE